MCGQARVVVVIQVELAELLPSLAEEFPSQNAVWSSGLFLRNSGIPMLHSESLSRFFRCAQTVQSTAELLRTLSTLLLSSA